jgi:hypothetical protein
MKVLQVVTAEVHGAESDHRDEGPDVSIEEGIVPPGRARTNGSKVQRPAQPLGDEGVAIHTHDRAPGTDVVTTTPRKALDGEVPRRRLVVVVPGDAPEGGEAGLKMAEEAVGLRR